MNNQISEVVTDTTEVKAPALDWDSFDDSDDENFNLSNSTPVAAPSACSLENPSCESCQ